MCPCRRQFLRSHITGASRGSHLAKHDECQSTSGLLAAVTVNATATAAATLCGRPCLTH